MWLNCSTLALIGEFVAVFARQRGIATQWRCRLAAVELSVHLRLDGLIDAFWWRETRPNLAIIEPLRWRSSEASGALGAAECPAGCPAAAVGLADVAGVAN